MPRLGRCRFRARPRRGPWRAPGRGRGARPRITTEAVPLVPGSGPWDHDQVGMASKPRRRTTMAGETDVQDRLAALPRRAVVAFAARCARRVQPLTHALPEQDRDAIARAIAVAEAFANGDAWATKDAARAAGDVAGATAGAAGDAAW